MRGKAPRVREFMSHLAIETERCDSVGDANEVMERHQIRHLPVMSGSKLVGVVSQRDILSARIRLGDKLDARPIEEIFESDVLTVGPNEPVDEVARQMLDRKAGSAVVSDGGFVVGIFTATDALKVLCALFDRSTARD